MHALNPHELVYLQDGGLLVDEAGHIVACESWKTLTQTHMLDGFDIKALPSTSVITPGFVDTHVHLPQMGVAGCQDQDLLSWLAHYIFVEESRFEDADYARRVSEWFFSALLANGTTLAAVFLTSHVKASQIAFETAQTLGNRVVMGQNLMDINAPASLLQPTDRLLAETETLCLQWHGQDAGRIQYAWIPRFAITSSEALLTGIGGLRKKYPDVYLHTHLSEQLPEITAVKAQFPWAQDYTAVYERFSLLGTRTILAHGIHLCDDELTRLKACDASLSHCPSSNFFLKSGRFRLFDVLKRQMRLGLGSDVGAGPELSLLKVMKDTQYMQADRLVSLKTLFYLATLGGAEALHQQERVGNFLPGKEADFVILDLAAKSACRSEGDEQPANGLESDLALLLSRLIYLGDDRLVQATYIRGKQLYPRIPRMAGE